MARYLLPTQVLETDPLFTPDVVARDPILLFLSDVRAALFQLLPNILSTVLPLRGLTSIFDDISPFGLLFQLFLFLYSFFLTVPLIVLGIFVGGISPLLAAFVLSLPLNWIQGGPLVQVPVHQSPVRDLLKGLEASLHGGARQQRRRRSTASANHYPRQHNGEAWFFVNGIATSRSGMVLDLMRLEQLFQRPVTGILNRSLGFLLDVLECVVQRDFGLHTRDVRFGYREIRAALEAKNVHKVVFLCHSQGGIITSLIVDLLLSTVNRSDLKKLEVYTFANAGNHFSNPINAQGEPTLAHVEHYANQLDPVAQFGVLKFIRSYKQTAQSFSTPLSAFCFDDPLATLIHSPANEQLEQPEELSAKKPKRRSNSSVLNGIKFGTDEQEPQAEKGGEGKEASKSALPTIHSAAGQFFSGVLFVRWHTRGHLLINHYLGPKSNILETPDARRYSRLRKYLGGKSPSD